MDLSSAFLTIILIALSAVLFTILFKGLDQSMLKLFESIKKRTSKLKRKTLYGRLILIGIIILASVLKGYYKVSNIKYCLLIGFSTAFIDISFDE